MSDGGYEDSRGADDEGLKGEEDLRFPGQGCRENLGKPGYKWLMPRFPGEARQESGAARDRERAALHFPGLLPLGRGRESGSETPGQVVHSAL